ncbi:MAG TPA: hypothetical protein VGJ99_06600 [Actinomycetota bacterium]
MNTVRRWSLAGALTLLAACGGSASVDPGYSAAPAAAQSRGAAPWPFRPTLSRSFGRQG